MIELFSFYYGMLYGIALLLVFIPTNRREYDEKV